MVLPSDQRLLVSANLGGALAAIKTASITAAARKSAHVANQRVHNQDSWANGHQALLNTEGIVATNWHTVLDYFAWLRVQTASPLHVAAGATRDNADGAPAVTGVSGNVGHELPRHEDSINGLVQRSVAAGKWQVRHFVHDVATRDGAGIAPNLLYDTDRYRSLMVQHGQPGRAPGCQRRAGR